MNKPTFLKADENQACPICPDGLTEPVFFEGRYVCLQHLADCESCPGLRLRTEPACGACVELVRPRARMVA